MSTGDLSLKESPPKEDVNSLEESPSGGQHEGRWQLVPQNIQQMIEEREMDSILQVGLLMEVVSR